MIKIKKPENIHYYFAYGSNMNQTQMKERCPRAEFLGAAILPDYKVVERRYADIDPEKGENAFGALYAIGDEDLENLDSREGTKLGIYERVSLDVQIYGGTRKAFVYIHTAETKKTRNAVKYSPKYIETCSKGAEDAGVPNAFAPEKFIRLFVYGTLMSGESNNRLLDGKKPFHAKIKGKLYDTGWEFPTFSPDGNADVQGELFRVPCDDFPSIDALEGYPRLYIRRQMLVMQDNGLSAVAWVYIMNKLPKRAKLIESGNWRER